MSVNDSITVEQLPAWMRQAKRGIDWGAILIIGFALIAAWSYLWQVNLSAATGHEAAAYRINETAMAFKDGVVYPRWSPHTLNGYGAPIAHFYPSGALYIGGLVSFLFPISPITVLQGLFVFSLIIGGSMVYTLVTQRTNALAGLVSGILYLFSPHIMSGTGIMMGDVSLATGAALLPALLWATNRLLMRDLSGDVFIIALIVAALAMTVPEFILQGIILVLVLLIVDFQQTVNYRKLFSIGTAFVIGIMIGAVYWLPAVVHAPQITWQPAMINAPDLLVTIERIIQLSAAIDPISVIPYPSFAIGWMLLITPIITLIFRWRYRVPLRLALSFLMMGITLLIIILVLMPHQSTWIISVILCFAIAGSGLFHTTTLPEHIQQASAILIVSLTVTLSIPAWILPGTLIPVDIPPPQEALEREQKGWGYTGLLPGQLLPSNITPEKAYSDPIADTYVMPLNRLTGGQAILIDETSHGGQYRIDEDSELNLIYRRAYFRLWSAQTGNRLLDVSATDDNQIALRGPRSPDDTLTIHIRPDNITQLAILIMLTGITTGIAITIYRLRAISDNFDESILLSRGISRLFTVILICAAGARISVDQMTEQLTQILNITSATAVNYERPFAVQTTLRFIDFRDLQPRYQQGETLQLQTIWELEQTPATQFVIDLQFIHSDTEAVAYSTGFDHIGYIPTDRWQSTITINHLYTIDIPDTLEAGNYTLQILVFDCDAPCQRNNVSANRAISIIPLPATVRID